MNMDYSKDYYKGLAKIYFNRILKVIIKMGNLKESGLTLDFGCGVGHLKRRVNNVIGYDIIEKLSDIDDYRTLKPEIIVCNGVLEHLTLKELKLTINNFKEMNINAILITSIPIANWLSKLGMILLNFRNAHENHKINREQINTFLSKECELLKRKNVFTMAEISLWRFK